MAHPKRASGPLPALLPDILDAAHHLRVMGRLIRRRVAHPGAAPGTLVRVGPVPSEAVRLTLTTFALEHVREEEIPTAADAVPFSAAPEVTWLNVDGIHDLDMIRELGEQLSLHPLVLEDIVNLGQRPKLEDHEHFLYIVLPMLTLEPGSGTVVDEQISLILGSNFVVTFQEHPGDVFAPVRERIRNPGARIRAQGADYLAYALIDAVVDHYFAVLESIGEAVERVEVEVTGPPRRDTMHRLHVLKREMLLVRRAVWPVRDMLNAMVRSDSPLITPATHIFLRDVYDHAIRIIDTVEVLRDVTAGTIDLHLSSLTHRTNEVMKTLTVIASIFIPLTFIAGVYGMNFVFMPELELRWAYPTLLALMATLALGMLALFRRRGWI